MKLRFATLFFCSMMLVAGCGGGGGGGGGGGAAVADSGGVQPTEQPTSSVEDWQLPRATAASVDLAQGDVDAVLDHVFTDQATQAVLVSKNGIVVGERYAAGFSANSLGTSWSVAKSFYSAAIGVAIADGSLMSVSQSASSVLTEFTGTDKEDITIEQILRMRSGLASNTNVFFQR